MPTLTMRRALALAKKKWGDRAFVRDNGAELTLTDAERAALMAEVEGLGKRPEIADVNDLPDSATIGEFKIVRAESLVRARQWTDARTALGARLRKRFDVGYQSAVANHIHGSGHTLEEALRSANVDIPQ